MTRMAVLLVFVWFALPLSRANAGEIRPICRVPSVLDVMARELHKRDYYARIEPRLIDEYPDVHNSVLCSVSVRTLSYNAFRADGVPLGRCEQHSFHVRALPNGFVVNYLR